MAELLRPGGSERGVVRPRQPLRRLRRASRLAVLRREVEPSQPAALPRSSPCPGHGIGRRRPARGVSVPLQAIALPVAPVGRCFPAPARCPAIGRSSSTRSLRAAGEVVWIGAGPDRVALYFREDAACAVAAAGNPSDPRGARDAP